MTLLASILMLALTRAEIIERVRAAPITKVNGLVQVIASCPKDMREEYQMPVSDFVSGVCKLLYTGLGERERRFDEPGIVLVLGDERTNRTDVVVRRLTRPDGSPMTKIMLPAPGFADIEMVRLETVRAFCRAVRGSEIDLASAERLLREADPALRVDDLYAELAAWRRGEAGGADDERMLRLARSVIVPGVARETDVLHFASRLFLYPETYAAPFPGGRCSCSFREAIPLARLDPRLRFLALAKSSQLVAFGGGRGEELSTAAAGYSDFLRALAAYTKSEEELGRMLDDADMKLDAALEAARRFEGGTQK